MSELYPFQEEGIAFALEREASLIADDMGLGKTVQAIGVINEQSLFRMGLHGSSESHWPLR
jgi:SNF2 family DNA or RNA helicase